MSMSMSDGVTNAGVPWNHRQSKWWTDARTARGIKSSR